MGLLTETVEAAKEVLGVERIAAVADKGYLKIEDIEACEKAGIDPYVPRPQRGPSVREGLFRKDEFRYDPVSDSFLCPAGQVLQPYSSSLLRGLKKVNYADKAACPNCPIRSQCTRSSFRMVSRPARSPPSGRPALPSPPHEPRQTTSGATARSPSHPAADRDARPPRSGQRPGCRSASAMCAASGRRDQRRYGIESGHALRSEAAAALRESRLGVIGQQHGRTPSQLRAGWPSVASGGRMGLPHQPS